MHRIHEIVLAVSLLSCSWQERAVAEEEALKYLQQDFSISEIATALATNGCSPADQQLANILRNLTL